MADLIEIQAQIDRLQKQAQEIRAREFEKKIREIVEQMQAYGITVRDIQQALSTTPLRGKGKARVAEKRPARKNSGGKRARSVATKYRGPNGDTWSGRGLMPRWLTALVAQGRSKEEFAVDA